MAPKKNLEHNLDSGNLDLSMSEIQDVPVNEIAAITKAISLDLSCNIIISLPKTFAPSLTRLVSLDLSKNSLTSLPDNFGLLVSLKHLDLYNNKLESLPLSFANLKSLRWLDVKSNPLMPKLSEIAGLCQDERQCQNAAKNIVAAFRSMQEQVNTELARRKEEQIKKTETTVEDAKIKNNKNQLKKKKKGKQSTDKRNPPQSNGEIHINGSGDKANLEDSSSLLSSDPKKKSDQNRSLLKRVGSILRILVKCIITSFLLMLFCGFILSLIDEDLYNSLQKKGSLLVRSNVPKDYLKQWDNGLLKSKRAITGWSNNAIFLFNRLQDNIVALSSDQVVQQYLESIQSGWQILWIYVNDTFATVSAQLSKYFGALTKSETSASDL